MSEPKSRSPLRKLMGVQIVGTGSFLPDNVVTNDDLALQGCDADWIFQRTGIQERRHAPPEMNTSDMAVAAAERCLEASGVKRSEIDLLLLATLSPDRLMPATATTVQDRLGLRCGAMDLSAACSGFTYALLTGMQFVATGGSKRALVIGSDTNTRVLDPKDRNTFPLFGDGAGAVILAPGSAEQGAVSYTLGAEGEGADLLCRESGGGAHPFCEEALQDRSWYFSMDGRAVFKWAVRLVEEVSREILDAAELSVDQIDWWIPHQANVRIINSVVDGLNIDRDRVVIHLDRYGNTSAGSIPIGLDETFRAGKIQRGQHLLMSGFGAGLTWGSTVWQW